MTVPVTKSTSGPALAKMVVVLAGVVALAGMAVAAQAQQQLQAQPQPAPAPPPAAAATPSQPSGDVPRANYIATMDGEFRRRDADGNGVVSRAEVERFETAAVYAAVQQRNRELFLRLDVDRNGSISPGEFAALVGSPGVPDVTAQMARLDSNRDQQVTLVEYRAAMLAAFDRLDTDLDGVVTAAELRAGNVQPAVPGR